MATTKQRELERHLARDRIVIREFYVELSRLGLMPEGMFAWTKQSARALARGIAEKARGLRRRGSHEHPRPCRLAAAGRRGECGSVKGDEDDENRSH